jgi:hypothetical protein
LMFLLIAKNARVVNDRMFYASAGLLTNCAQWNGHRSSSRPPRR